MLRLSLLIVLLVATVARAEIYTVSILPLRGIVSELAGPKAQVHTMVGPGQSPETFEPTSRQLTRLARSRAFFMAGLPFEAALGSRIAGQFPGLLCVDVTSEIARLPLPPMAAIDHAPDHSHDHDHGENDPHVWTGPSELRQIAARIAAALIELQPNDAAAIAARHADFDARIVTLDHQIEVRLRPYAGRSLLAYHPAYGYFAARYGLRQIAVESGGMEPGARHLVELAGRLRSEDVRLMVVSPQFSPDRARNLARALGVEMLVLDPLSESVEAMLLEFTDALEKAFAAPSGAFR